MNQNKSHDLHDFMSQISHEISAEYSRIQKRATEDPGTSGDEGEENWAAILRDWLPRNYEVVTKGRIISADGRTSPQIDILVLKETYPRKLLNKKIYLAAGVVAAFECKITLKAIHIEEAVKHCTIIKSLYLPRFGTPYKELHSPIFYGLLAHSHSWKSPKSTPKSNIENKLLKSDMEYVQHPRLQLDVICIADFMTWEARKITFIGPKQKNTKNWSTLEPHYGLNGSAMTSYVGYSQAYNQSDLKVTPIGTFINYLTQRLAWENTRIRELADYYRLTHITGSGHGSMRPWSISIYSESLRSRLESFHTGTFPWSEWNITF